jgi:spore maturation protein CgeD
MLEKAIQSVLNQTYQDFEILLMDDNSKMPQQLAILDKYKNHPKVIFYQSDVKDEDRVKTVRYADLVNIAFTMLHGEFVTYLCDDDYFFDYRLKTMVDYLDEHPDVSVVYGRQRMIRIFDDREIASSTRDAEHVLDNPNTLVDHSSVMHRASCIKVCGNWPNDKGLWGAADGAYWEKLAKAGFLFYPIKKVLDVHIYHEGSWTGAGRWQSLKYGGAEPGSVVLDSGATAQFVVEETKS